MKHRLPFEILFEDRDVIVIDKPAGMLTTHTQVAGRAAREAQVTAENLLNDYVRKGQAKSRNRVWLVHRLDRETSGVMMFAKSEEVAEWFRSNWNELTEKTYVAKVVGAMAEREGVFESYLREDADGYKVRSVKPREDARHTEMDRPREDARHTESRPKFARTEWKVVSAAMPQPGDLIVSRASPRGLHPCTSLVEVKLKSGRKNQIRVHFSEAGHPVVGDVKYGGPKSDRLYLHALRLRFRHPHTHQWMEYESPCVFL